MVHFYDIRMITMDSREAMNYCSLDDAFPAADGAPSPGCMNDQAARQARKEERRKMKRCKQDPDRQQYGKLPEVPPMNPNTGLTEHTPSYAPQSEMDSQSWSMQPFEQMVPLPGKEGFVGQDNSQPTMGSRKKYFGADPDDNYATYAPEQSNFQLEPNFLASFEQTGVNKASALPMPSANNYWKPITPSGQTSFIESLPPPGGRYYSQKSQKGDVSMEEMMKRMDMLFARLDDLNSTTPEQMTSELLMFISSGIFVLFMMDLLVKKGSTMRF
jgi:hypothetical protein